MKSIITLLCFFSCIYTSSAQFGPFNDVLEGYILSPSELIPIDFDMDGDMDMVVAGDSHVFWLENIGDGNFTYIDTIAVTEALLDFAVSDFDMDGDYDIIIVDATFFIGGNILFYENLGDTDFAIDPIELTGLDEVSEIEVVDYDNDGDPDFVGVNGTNIIWFEADGTGGISEEHVLATDILTVLDFIVADIDNDTDFDIIWSEVTPSSFVYFIENMGDGVYGVPKTLYSGLQYAQSIVATDLDGDGDLDIAYGTNGDAGGIIYWNENLGDGLFGPPITLSNMMMGRTIIAAGDMDLDGDIDIVASSKNNDNIYAFRNLGAGAFELDQLLIDNLNKVNYIALADFEGDGDLDVFSLGNPPKRVGWFENYALDSIFVSGQLYYDENENGIMDDAETGIAGIIVNSGPEGTIAVTNDDGYYEMSFLAIEEGDYEIFPVLENWEITSAYDMYEIVVSDEFIHMDTLDFGLSPNVFLDQIGTDLSGGYTALCRDTVVYWLSVSNMGTTFPDGVLHLELDDSLAYVDSEILPDSIDGENIYWSYDDLFFFESETFYVYVGTPDGEEDTVTSFLTTTIILEEETVYSVMDVLIQPVNCIYDSKVKTPNPKGVGPLGYILPTTEWIEYTVRFQNTSSDTVADIIIRDLLDEDLIWHSIQPLFSSHDMTFEFDPMGELTFIFNDIMLPDSNTNELESHGFVIYRIKLKPGLSNGTLIENTARIYFDYNPTVMTNTALNTTSTLTHANVENLPAPNGVIVYPNPTSDLVNIIINQDMSSGYSVSLVNLMGQEVYSDSNLSAEKMTIQTSDFESGVYILRVTYGEDQSMVYTTKLIIE